VTEPTEQQWFKDYLDSWATNDVDAVLAFAHDDIVYEDTTIGHAARGIQGFRKFVAASFRNVPDASFDYVHLETMGDAYFLEWVMQPMGVRGVSVGRRADGKMIDNRDYWNGAAYTVVEK
jgi:ketosteroid isomerase-like protein